MRLRLPWGWRAWALGALPAALALRLYRLTAQSLTYDEGVSAARALLGWKDILAEAALDTHPPLYELLLGRWVALVGDTDYSLRFFSVLGGILAIALGARLARHLLGGPAAGLVAWLLAGSPLAIFYSQEARMYALFFVLVLLTSAGALGWMGRLRSAPRPPSHPLWPALYVGGAVLALFTHYFAAAWLLVAQVWYLVTRGSPGAAAPTVRGWVGCHVAVALLYAPWLGQVVARLGSYGSHLGEYGFWGYWLALGRFLVHGPTPPAGPAADLAAAILLGAVGAWSMARSTGQRRATLVVTALLTPPALLWIVSLWRPALSLRFLLPCLFWALLLQAAGVLAIPRAAALRALPRWAAVAALALVLLAIQARGVRAYHLDPSHQRDGYRQAAAHLEAQAHQGAIVLHPGGQDLVLRHYYSGDLAVYRLGYEAPLAWSQQVEEDLSAWMEGAGALHLLQLAPPYSDPEEQLMRWLGSRHYTGPSHVFPSLRLTTFAAGGRAWRRGPEGLSFGPGLVLDHSRYTSVVGSPGFVLAELRWSRSGALSPHLSLFLHLRTADHGLVAQQDGQPLGGVLPFAELPTEPFLDRRAIPMPPDLAPGSYLLVAGIYDPYTGDRLRVEGPDLPPASEATLGQVTILR